MNTMTNEFGRGLTANEVLESMVVDSVGADSPMTRDALNVASVEVGGRLDAARDVLDDSTRQINTLDPKALCALLMIDIESGHFKQQ